MDREGPVLGGGIAQGSGEVPAAEGRPDRGEHRAAGAWTRGPRSVWKEGTPKVGHIHSVPKYPHIPFYHFSAPAPPTAPIPVFPMASTCRSFLKGCPWAPGPLYLQARRAGGAWCSHTCLASPPWSLARLSG